MIKSYMQKYIFYYSPAFHKLSQTCALRTLPNCTDNFIFNLNYTYFSSNKKLTQRCVRTTKAAISKESRPTQTSLQTIVLVKTSKVIFIKRILY